MNKVKLKQKNTIFYNFYFIYINFHKTQNIFIFFFKKKSPLFSCLYYSLTIFIFFLHILSFLLDRTKLRWFLKVPFPWLWDFLESPCSGGFPFILRRYLILHHFNPTVKSISPPLFLESKSLLLP